MADMQFGLMMRAQFPQGDDMQVRFREMLEQARLADELGYSCITNGMHYSSAPWQDFQQFPFLCRIMAEAPCAILVVTATVTGNFAQVYDAMGAGALDAVNTPLQAPGTEGAAALLAKIDTIRKLIGNSGAKRIFAPKPEVVVPLHPQGQLVLIGASAGGPAALARILADLPASFGNFVVDTFHFLAHCGIEVGRRERLAVDGHE